jgi:hypothetical protein
MTMMLSFKTFLLSEQLTVLPHLRFIGADELVVNVS